MDSQFNDPLLMTPEERRRRIVELLTIALGRLAAAQQGKGASPPSEKGLDSSGKGR